MKQHNTTGMGYAQYIDSDFWYEVDEKKLSTITIIDRMADSKMLSTLPYFIKTIGYTGKNSTILHHLNSQYDNLKPGIWTRSKIFMDWNITSKCNLTCANCSMFSQYKSIPSVAKEGEDLEVVITKFKKYTLKEGGPGITIKLMGGEPLVIGKPKIDNIILRLTQAGFKVILLTNGIMDYTPPIPIAVENSSKDRYTKPLFHTTMDAPRDHKEFDGVDYSKGCEQVDVCGAMYNSGKLYPCTQAIQISNLQKIPLKDVTTDTLEEMTDEFKTKAFNKLCPYCGNFKRIGKHNLDKDNYMRADYNLYSKSWEFMNGRN